MLKKNSSLIFLVFLLSASVALLSFQIKRDATPPLKRWILNATAPIIKTANMTLRGIGGAVRKYIYLKNLYTENVSLKQEIQSLKLQAWDNAERVSANTRLSLLLDMRGEFPFDTKGARVVIKNPSIFSETIFINTGARDGIRIDTPVIGSEGIVGRVISSAYDMAEVQLITHAAAATGATIETSRVQGVAKGTGQEFLTLEHIKMEETVKVGDPIVTSGMDGIYPKGFPIGKVSDVREGPSVFKIIRIKPSTNFSKLEEVLLLLKSDS